MSEGQTLQAMIEAVVEAIEDKKAQDVVVMDVQGECAFTDCFVLATGRTDRQLKAIAQAVAGVAHANDLPAKIEGLEAMEWLLVDLGDVVVHLFLPDTRASFQLERLWEHLHDAASLDSATKA